MIVRRIGNSARDFKKNRKCSVDKKSHLHVFDFDDTLFFTDNTVKIVTEFNSEIHLNSREYALFEMHKELPEKGITKELAKQIILNYDNFEKVVNPRPVQRNLHIFRNILKHSNISSESLNLYIVTARSGHKNRLDIKNAVDKFCQDLLPDGGFPITHIITKDLQVLGNSTAEKKRMKVEELMKEKNLDRVHFLDDSIKNIEEMSKIPGRFRLVTCKEDDSTPS